MAGSQNDLQREVLHLRNENVSLQIQVEKLQAALARTTEQVADHALSGADKTSSRIKQEYQQLYAKHEYAQKLYSKLLDDYEYLKTRSESTHQLNERLSAENEELRLDNIRLRQMQEKLAGDYETAYNMVTELRENHAQDQGDNALLLTEVGRLTQMINDSRFKDGYQLMEEVRLLREQLGSSRQRKTSAGLKKANRVLQGEITDIREDLDDLRQLIVDQGGKSGEARLAELRAQQQRSGNNININNNGRREKAGIRYANVTSDGDASAATRQGLNNLSETLDAIDSTLRTRTMHVPSSAPRPVRGQTGPLLHRTYTAPDWPQGDDGRGGRADKNTTSSRSVTVTSYKRTGAPSRGRDRGGDRESRVGRRQTTTGVVQQARVDNVNVEYKEIPRNRYVDASTVSQSMNMPKKDRTWTSLVTSHDKTTGNDWSISQPSDRRSRSKHLRHQRARSQSPTRRPPHGGTLLDNTGHDLHSPGEKPYRYTGSRGHPGKHCDVCSVLLSAGVSTSYCHRHRANRKTEYTVPPHYKPNMAYSDPIDLAANLAFISGKQLKSQSKPSWRF